MSVKNLVKSDRITLLDKANIKYDKNKTKGKLLNFCKKYEKIYLYGAGDVGAGYASILKYENIPVEAFIVTKKSFDGKYCNLPVYELCEILPKLSEKDGIIFAVGDKLYAEMKNNIPQNFPTLFINDFWYVRMQEEYFNEIINKNLIEIEKNVQLKKRMLKEGCILSRELIRKLSLLCCEDEDDPNLFFNHQLVRLKDTKDKKRTPFFIVDDVGIVLQGPICKKNNFTLRTVIFYRELYPNTPIVISTWEGETNEEFKKICVENNIIILENKLPDNPGAQHINYQMFSSLCGVRYVKENTKAKYVIKTRTDRRINRKDFLIYLKNLLKLYPPIDNKLKARICFIYFSFQPFFIADYESFGTVEDIEKLYSSNINQSKKETPFLQTYDFKKN